MLAAVCAATSGIALDRLVTSLAVPRPAVTLQSVTPGALDHLGVTLTAVVPPADCGLPVHWSPCPITRAEAEAGGLRAVGYQARPVEAVLADVRIPATASPNGRPVVGSMWVVAADRQQRLAASCPCCAPPRPTLVPYCFPAKHLAFVDALTGRVRLVAARP